MLPESWSMSYETSITMKRASRMPMVAMQWNRCRFSGALEALACFLLGAVVVFAEPAPIDGTSVSPRFLYEQSPLAMTADALRDADGAFSLEQLPAPTPMCKTMLKGDITPPIERMWKIAIDDVEHNQVTHESGAVYFVAGTHY